MKKGKIRLLGLVLGTIAGSIIMFGILADIPFTLPLKLLMIFICAFLGFVIPKDNNLSDIAADEAGDNQHGSARWSTEKEQKEIYSFFTEKEALKSGIIIGHKGNKFIVDTSDQNLNLVAPPGSGKTKRVIIPTIYYNGLVNKNTNGNGASMILTDNKGELYNSTSQALRNYGYKTACLDFANPLASLKYNILCNVNRYIDEYKATTDKAQKIIAYGKAERYAKVLADSIITTIDSQASSDASEYFNETARGLITGITLLVSEFGEENQRHIISVFKLIIELNGLSAGSSDMQQTSKLEELLSYVDNERINNYVGASMKADVRTAMNIFSSALGKLVKFIDAELEQMICGHSSEIGYVDFLKNPTAIYLVCPDENPTRHFFASLFIRYMTNDLIEESRKYKGQELPRKVLYLWDEFGNMPPIKNIDTIFSAARSRGIRILIALQSYAQLEKVYNRQMAEVILDSTQITMFTYVSPNSEATAERFSKMLGQQTVKTGSLNYSSQTNSIGVTSKSINYSLIGRSLLMPSEIMTLPAGTFIVVKAGKHPSKFILPFWWNYINKKNLPFCDLSTDMKNIKEISYLTVNQLKLLTKPSIFYRGMYD